MNNKSYAKYLNIEFNYECVLQMDSNFDDMDGFVRLTEPLEIEFTYLSQDNKKQIAFIDKKIEEIQIDTEAKLKALKEKRSKLLALPNLRDAG